ncbi:MAG: hypothetical protein JSW52_05440 [Candidatus Coatesbacteria bacterium]|nr:MAG: hypothetical protein JSW52_05440 [Candidatus Coatesbacteria bacterium]
MNAEPETTDRRRKQGHLHDIYWAGVLIWAGLVFMAESMGYLPQIGYAGAWSWVFFGAGLYGLLGALWREFSVRYARPKVGDYVWAGVLILIGLGGLAPVSQKLTWPLVLLLIGFALLASFLFKRK